MKRRALLTGLWVIAFTCSADAQQTAVAKIGVITFGVEASSPYLEALRPGLAAELVRLNPSVIVTEGTPAALAVSRATKTIPNRTAKQLQLLKESAPGAR